MFQRIRSRRLRRSYTSNSFQFQNLDPLEKDEIPMLKTCIVISSEEDDQFLVESISENVLSIPLLVDVMKDSEKELQNNIDSNIQIRNQDYVFHEVKNKMQSTTKKSTTFEQTERKQQMVNTISYKDYKFLMFKDTQQQKLQKIEKQEKFQQQINQKGFIDLLNAQQIIQPQDLIDDGYDDELKLLRQQLNDQKYQAQIDTNIKQQILAPSIAYQATSKQIYQPQSAETNVIKFPNVSLPEYTKIQSSNLGGKQLQIIESKNTDNDEILDYDSLVIGSKIIPQSSKKPEASYESDERYCYAKSEKIKLSQIKKLKKLRKYSLKHNSEIFEPPLSKRYVQTSSLVHNQILSIVGKRESHRQQIEYMCTQKNQQVHWIAQQFLVQQYCQLIFSFEKLISQKLMETKLCDNIMKIRHANVYSILSHTITKTNIRHKIVNIKILEKKESQDTSRDVLQDESQEKYQYREDLQFKHQKRGKRLKRQHKQKLKDHRSIIRNTDDVDVDNFYKQLTLKQMDADSVSKIVTEVRNQDSPLVPDIIEPIWHKKQIQKPITVISFKQKLRQIRLNKLIHEMQSKQMLKSVDHGLSSKFTKN